MKSLDRKLAAIHADPGGSREFILADAKDADMAFGIPAPGEVVLKSGEPGYRTLAEFRDQIRSLVRDGILDIMLMSNSTSEQLTLREGLFNESDVTPAVRINDSTDIWVFRGSRIGTEASRPFRTASIDHAQSGRLDGAPAERSRGANLGLYSITFNNDRDRDRESLEAYQQFRHEAERLQFRHFLEVFAPNVPGAVEPQQLPYFLIDAIVRTLAGVSSAGRPLFLKMPYLGPKPLEQLVAYDPHLIVGVLGGAAGTTRDAFQLLHNAQRHGARLALFGRKINQAEDQPTFVRHLRAVADRDFSPEEGVRAYHAALGKSGLAPRRSLEDDLRVTEPVLQAE